MVHIEQDINGAPMTKKFRIAIAGASGYAGAELVRLAAAHPYFTITAVTSEKSAGQAVASVFPSFKGIVDHQFEALAPEALTERADSSEIRFLATSFRMLVSVRFPRTS